MKRKLLLDTSFIIAFLYDQDSLHGNTRPLIRTRKEDEIEMYISELIDIEVVSVLCAKNKLFYLVDTWYQLKKVWNIQTLQSNLGQYLSYHKELHIQISVCDVSVILDAREI